MSREPLLEQARAVKHPGCKPLVNELADEIERLTEALEDEKAEIAQLRAALQPFAKMSAAPGGDLDKAIQIARAAFLQSRRLANIRDLRSGCFRSEAQAVSRTWQSDPVDLQSRLCNQITQLRAEVARLRGIEHAAINAASYFHLGGRGEEDFDPQRMHDLMVKLGRALEPEP